MKTSHLILTLLTPIMAFADHPNEGSLGLRELLAESRAKNPALQSASLRNEASEADYSAARAALRPKVSLEGGPVQIRSKGGTTAGTALYGKAEWNLYRGGADSAAIQKARLQTEISKVELRLAEARLAREVATSYYEILYLLESETLLTRALEMNLAQSKLAKTKRSAGFTGETDVLEFELREATIKSDLKRLEKERTSQLRDLARLLGRPLEAQLPTVHGHLARPAKPLQKEALTDALDSNPEIVRAKAEHEGRVLDLKTAVSSFLPTVDLEGRYGKLADEDAVSKKSNDYHLALKVNVPIFAAGENTSNLRSARAQSARSEIETERLRDRIRREAQDLLEEAQSLRERLALEERNLERSESYYKLSLNEYKRGIKNSPDVVGASERLLETKLRNLEFRRDIALNRLKVQEIQGSMEIPAD